MYILAGVDEAGLGPTLGPLVTGCAALRVPDDWEVDSPWRCLDKALCGSWRKGETRLVVADSKALYRRAGLGVFERVLGAFSQAAGGRNGLAFSLADAAAAVHPCYRDEREEGCALGPFPVYAPEAELAEAAESLRAGLDGAGAAAVHLAARGLFEPAMNGCFARGLNKNQVLLRETGSHLLGLHESYPDLPIRVIVDKQGGRNDYLAYLLDLFAGGWVEELSVGGSESRYRLRRGGGRDMEMIFRVRADAGSFATALASMAAKYVRERLMSRLNAWFCRRWDGLAPTAGYPVDAARWLADMEAFGATDAGRIDLVRRLR